MKQILKITASKKIFLNKIVYFGAIKTPSSSVFPSEAFPGILEKIAKNANNWRKEPINTIFKRVKNLAVLDPKIPKRRPAKKLNII